MILDFRNLTMWQRIKLCWFVLTSGQFKIEGYRGSIEGLGTIGADGTKKLISTTFTDKG